MGVNFFFYGIDSRQIQGYFPGRTGDSIRKAYDRLHGLVEEFTKADVRLLSYLSN
jgi:hypothetical protein